MQKLLQNLPKKQPETGKKFFLKKRAQIVFFLHKKTKKTAQMLQTGPVQANRSNRTGRIYIANFRFSPHFHHHTFTLLSATPSSPETLDAAAPLTPAEAPATQRQHPLSDLPLSDLLLSPRRSLPQPRSSPPSFSPSNPRAPPPLPPSRRRLRRWYLPLCKHEEQKKGAPICSDPRSWIFF